MFVHPPVSFFVVLAGLVAAYRVIVERVKIWFYKRYSSFIEKIIDQNRIRSNQLWMDTKQPGFIGVNEVSGFEWSWMPLIGRETG